MFTENWFDTTFYHTLYKDRNDQEAMRFMDNLLAHLALPPKSKILDLACGKGRHSIYLNTLGYDVLGLDSSAGSIAHAKTHENSTLKFLQHDMRIPLNMKFDAVFNFFTSFGYFSDDNDNKAVLKNITSNLANNGVGVIDFMNINYVVANLVPEEAKTVDNITFYLKRYVDKGMLCKSIKFNHDGKDYAFLEQVKLLSLKDFEAMLGCCCASIQYVFGDYDLNPFDNKASSRVIIVFIL